MMISVVAVDMGTAANTADVGIGAAMVFPTEADAGKPDEKPIANKPKPKPKPKPDPVKPEPEVTTIELGISSVPSTQSMVRRLSMNSAPPRKRVARSARSADPGSPMSGISIWPTSGTSPLAPGSTDRPPLRFEGEVQRSEE